MNEKLLTALAKSGPWALLAGVLILYGLVEIRPALAAIPAIRAEHNEMRAEFNASQKQVIEYAKRSAYLERRNCINTARDETQRLACARDEE